MINIGIKVMKNKFFIILDYFNMQNKIKGDKYD
jgi:hypothetical protein